MWEHPTESRLDDAAAVRIGIAGRVRRRLVLVLVAEKDVSRRDAEVEELPEAACVVDASARSCRK